MMIQMVVDGECLIELAGVHEDELRDIPKFLEKVVAPALRQIALHKGVVKPRTRESVLAEIAESQK